MCVIRQLLAILIVQCGCVGPAIAQTPVSREAAEAVELKTTRKHPIKYFVALPMSAHAVSQRLPVLVYIDGSASLFCDAAAIWREKLVDLPVIVVVPCTFSNTNFIFGPMRTNYRKYYTDELIDNVESRLDWDEAGLLAILDDMPSQYGADERVYVCGHSGGGLLTYRMICKHPDRLAGAAAACANIHDDVDRPQGRRATGADLELPIYMITGEDDPFSQNMRGLNTLKVLLFSSVLGLAIGYVIFKRIQNTKRATIMGVVATAVLYLVLTNSNPGIDSQTDDAHRLLTELGYSNLHRTGIPGMGHSPAWEHVIACFESRWRERAKTHTTPFAPSEEGETAVIDGGTSRTYFVRDDRRNRRRSLSALRAVTTVAERFRQ